MYLNFGVNSRDYSKENISKFYEYLGKLTFSDIYKPCDPDIAYTLFINEFKLLYDLCFPFRVVIINVNKKPGWISKGIKICSKRKR